MIAHHSTIRPPELDHLAATIQRRWADGEHPDALAALAAHPELAAHKPLVLELAYEEFCTRADGGEQLNPAAFAHRFPFAQSVARLLAIHSVVGRHTSFARAERPAVALQSGAEVGELRVLRRLGQGGFSDVYLVSNTALGGRHQVLKVSTRGQEEADVVGPLTHPHLMPVWDVRRVGNEPAVVSPYLGLSTVETVLERAEAGFSPSTEWLLGIAGERLANDPAVADPPSFPLRPDMPYPRAVLPIAAAVADALQYLHGRTIAHRDLKPSNLLLGPTGYPYLLDFNLADDGRSGRVGGTVPYAAPEVLAALAADHPDARLDWRAADVFSFAVLVCELLLLRHPYLVGDALARIDTGTVSRAAASARTTISHVRLPVPATIRQLLLASLDVDPTARPTAAELALGLSRAIAPPSRRWWLAAATAAALSLGGSALAWGLWDGADREPTEPFARGCWLVRHGHTDIAIPAFLEAEKTDATGRASEWLAYCYAANGNYPTSTDHANRAIAAGRTTAAVYANRAAARLHTGGNRGAVNDAEEAVRLAPACREAKLSRGMARFRLQPKGQPVPRPVVIDLEAGLDGNEGNGGLWAALAEARARVEGINDEDRKQAAVAAAAAVRAGYPRLGLEKCPALKAQIAQAQLIEALSVAQTPEPLPTRSPFVRPDW